jgi:hypothetical protein
MYALVLVVCLLVLRFSLTSQPKAVEVSQSTETKAEQKALLAVLNSMPDPASFVLESEHVQNGAVCVVFHSKNRNNRVSKGLAVMVPDGALYLWDSRSGPPILLTTYHKDYQ